MINDNVYVFLWQVGVGKVSWQKSKIWIKYYKSWLGVSIKSPYCVRMKPSYAIVLIVADRNRMPMGFIWLNLNTESCSRFWLDNLSNGVVVSVLFCPYSRRQIFRYTTVANNTRLCHIDLGTHVYNYIYAINTIFSV